MKKKAASCQMKTGAEWLYSFRHIQKEALFNEDYILRMIARKTFKIHPRNTFKVNF
jgi:hypothetical protein